MRGQWMVWFVIGLLVTMSPATNAVSQYAEAIDVRLVNIDVTVTDKNGRPISGIARANFSLWVDGREVPISHFAEIVRGPSEGRENERKSENGPSVRHGPDPEDVTWAVFVDCRERRPARRTAVLRRLRDFLVGMGRDGYQGMLATFDGRSLTIRKYSARDVGEVVDELNAVQRGRVMPTFSALESRNVSLDIRYSAASEEQAWSSAEMVKALMAAEAEDARSAMTALSTFVDVVPSESGRVAVVYVGPGFETLPGLAVSQQWHNRFSAFSWRQWAPKPEDYRVSLERAYSALVARLQASRIALYALYASDDEVGVPTAEDASETEQATRRDESLLHSMGLARELAEETGGRLLKEAALPEQLASIEGLVTHYYSIAYRDDGVGARSQRIEVRVNHPGVSVHHRREVLFQSREEEAATASVAALFRNEERSPLSITLQASLEARRPRHHLLTIRIPTAGVGLVEDGGALRGSVSIHFAVTDSEGRLWRLEPRRLPLAIPVEAAGSLAEITYEVKVPRLGRNLRIAVSVHDETTGTIVTETTELSDS